jgi:4-amino-4-deoxy-L-arabinose transferase-like glycosyltransferase
LVSVSPLQRNAALVLLLAFAVLWFGNLDYRSLVRPDEGRYAEIPREMAVTGDWLTPRLNAIKYFEKPPLQYWATAAAYEAFGEHEWTVRLWPALTGFAGVLLVALFGARLFGAAAGLYSALVLATSMGYMFVAHIATLDMGFTLFTTAAMGGFALGLAETTPAASRKRWLYIAWAAMGLAMLSKGLAGIVLPLFALGVYALAQRDIGIAWRVRPVTGLMLFLLIAAPWFVAVSIANPEFPYFFFVHEHFARYLTTVHHRYAPWWYFIPILALGMLPWVLALPGALRAAWHRPPARAFHPARYLTIYAAAIFIFFSLSDSKLPSYILPMFPALALLAGAWLAAAPERAIRRTLLFYAALGLLLLALAPLAVRFAPQGRDLPLFAAYVPWLQGAAVVMLGGAGIAWLTAHANRTRALLAIALSALVAEQAMMMGHDELAPRMSFHAMAQHVRPYLDPATKIYSVGTYEQTLPFYLKRTVTLVAFADEMAYGLEQEPQLAIPTVEQFERVWRGERDAIAVVRPDLYDKLAHEGLPMSVIARDARLVVVSRTPPTKPDGGGPS